MYGHLIAMGLGMVLGARLLSWPVARRLGVRWALALPLAALGAVAALRIRSGGPDFHDGIGLAAAAAVFAAPGRLGSALIGSALIGSGLIGSALAIALHPLQRHGGKDI